MCRAGGKRSPVEGTLSVGGMYSHNLSGFHGTKPRTLYDGSGRSTTERGQRTVLGSQLRKRKDQVIGDYCIKAADSKHNASQWYLKPVMAASAATAETPPIAPAATSDDVAGAELFEIIGEDR